MGQVKQAYIGDFNIMLGIARQAELDPGSEDFVDLLVVASKTEGQIEGRSDVWLEGVAVGVCKHLCNIDDD